MRASRGPGVAIEIPRTIKLVFGYSQMTVVPWLVKVFTPRVGRRCEAGYELDSEQGCDIRARFF